MFLIDAAQFALGSAMTVALLAAAIHVVLASRSHAEEGLALAWVRASALAAMAGYVWLRPGIKPAGRPTLVYLTLMAILLAAVAWLPTKPAGRRLIDWFAHGGPRVRAATILGLVVLALPALVKPITAHWDVSGWMDSQSYDAFAINIVTGKAAAGSSGYMPVYQYGMALVYYAFGHFFFAQQIVNVLMAIAGIVCLSLAAWTLFGSVTAAWVAGLLYVACRQLLYALQFTQIETWYVPIVCAVLLAWTRFWRAPSLRTAAWLGAAIGLGLNTRNQGAVFFAFMCLAPLCVVSVAWRRRIAQLLVVGGVVALTLVPWTLRNLAVEGRLSPFADRSAMYIGILTDPRIGLYGIRYWEGWDEVAVQYQSRYADKTERERAYLQGAWRNVTDNPGWLARAIVWRTAAFYGVLPDGLLNFDRIIPTIWRDEWARYLFSRTTPLVLLPLSLLTVLIRRDRASWFLAGAVAASVAITAVSASPEDRISYPVLPIHILLCAGLFASRRIGSDPAVAATPGPRPWRRLSLAAATVVLVLAASRALVGAHYEYRPLKERAVTIDPAVAVDAALPSINDWYGAHQLGQTEPLQPRYANGARARLRGMVSNYMYPPKFVGPVSFVPAFASDPATPTFYFGYLLTEEDRPQLGPAVGLSFAGAVLSDSIREGDAVELEGEIVHGAPQTVTGFWLRVTRVRKLPIAASSLPVFP